MNSPIPQSVLKASGVVGTWAFDPWEARLSLGARVARLLGLDPAAAARGIPLADFLDRTHPDDRLRMEAYLDATGAVGCPVEAEFRTGGAWAGVRTLVMRGRIDSGPTGAGARGCGIVIDRTDELSVGLLPGEQTVNRMAEHVIALRSLAQTTRQPVLVEGVEVLMVAVGRELARFVCAPGNEALH